MDRKERKILQNELAFVGFVEFIRADPQMAYILADAYVNIVKDIAAGKAVVKPGEEAQYEAQRAEVAGLLRKALPGLEVVTPEEAAKRDAEREAKEEAIDAAEEAGLPEGGPPKGTLLN